MSVDVTDARVRIPVASVRNPALRVRIPVTNVDESFPALGSTVRIAITAPDARGLLARARNAIRDFEACASRFRPDSELCALNADRRAVVPASRQLRDAVRAALWAAERSGGLVDPCLLDALEAAGYLRSLARVELTPLSEVKSSRTGHPARPHRAARWRQVRVDDRRGTIERPPGLRLDLGGSGKGHVADRVAGMLGSARSWVVDAGGDVRVGGEHEVHVAHPLGGPPAARLRLSDCAAATSSIVRRSWRNEDGAIAHHLLDPATGRPVWTGLLAVTALAPTTLEAETLSKAALLSGREHARRILARHGGVVIGARGEVVLVGPLPADAAETAPGGGSRRLAGGDARARSRAAGMRLAGGDARAPSRMAGMRLAGGDARARSRAA
jgi:thiamine biosynthesis lipoprotein